MQCEHNNERLGDLIEFQIMGRLNVRTVTTRDVVARVRGMIVPEGRLAEHRDSRHRMIKSAIAAINDERAMMAQFKL